ncbi:helix-turn-helix domain-containing protein, partial [Ferrimicrobium acidiphilum]|uniref:helix-turn-helix domain-containing protein n=1 Tax=Ferrimicrobium acidiphilum TaxID=121039 RepID=UPI00352FAC72
MRKAEEVLRLGAQGKHVREISRSTGMSRTTVTRYLEKAAEHEIGWPLPEGMDVQA